jgi:hypothetical protein
VDRSRLQPLVMSMIDALAARSARSIAHHIQLAQSPERVLRGPAICHPRPDPYHHSVGRQSLVACRGPHTGLQGRSAYKLSLILTSLLVVAIPLTGRMVDGCLWS